MEHVQAPWNQAHSCLKLFLSQETCPFSFDATAAFFLSASRKGVQAAERVLLFLLKVIQSPSPPVALTEKARSLRQEGDGLFVYT
jgi:hypothetical protein